MVDHNRRLKHYPQVKNGSSDELEVSWVTSSPNDFIAGSLISHLPARAYERQIRTALGTTYREYMCVPTAIIKS